MDFRGKTCIVTGATSGIGLATARRLAGLGAGVVLTGRNAEKGSHLAKELRAVSGRAVFVPGDLADVTTPKKICQAALSSFGRIDVLVNNASILVKGNALECSDADWDRTLELNVSAVLRMSRAVLPTMMSQGAGTIVNVTSDWALVGAKGALAYSVSKAAVAQMTRCMALDHAESGIRVNAVCPGDTETPMLGIGLTGAKREAKLAELGADLPLQRVGKPEEVANVIAFLASDLSSFMTGALVPVDGGNTAQ